MQTFIFLSVVPRCWLTRGCKIVHAVAILVLANAVHTSDSLAVGVGAGDIANLGAAVEAAHSIHSVHASLNRITRLLSARTRTNSLSPFSSLVP